MVYSRPGYIKDLETITYREIELVEVVQRRATSTLVSTQGLRREFWFSEYLYIRKTQVAGGI